MPDKMDASRLFVVSGRSLRILAAIAWVVGGVVLLLKGSSLLVAAGTMSHGKGWPGLAAVAGVFIGGIKAKYIFSKSCQKNIDRIADLNRPRLWQFFRPVFFVALIVMILLGETLSRLAQINYPWLIGVAILDLDIGIALLGSSYVFWRHKALET